MRRYSVIPLLLLFATAGCGDDDGPGAPEFQYSLAPDAPAIAVGQDSSVTLGVVVNRSDNTTVTSPRLIFSSADYRIATVDGAGVVTGVSGGTTDIHVTFGTTTIDVPVTVNPRPATLIELTVLSGPAGGLKTVSADTGTFYALPADPATSRLKGLVLVGTDTVFCNYCVARPTGQPPRVMRVVRFRSLNPALATVTNAANPKLQASTDTTGRVTPLDTSSAGVQIVMEVPGDSAAGVTWADTVFLKFALRPLDTLRIRPDSNFFPTTNGTGLIKMVYPNADTVAANVVASANTNFIAGLDFLSRVQDLPAPPGTGTLPAARFIPVRITGGPTVRRPSLPNVTWESANLGYLQINAAGAITGICAFIGGSCPTANSSVLHCLSTGSQMPANFLGQGNYNIPSCNPTRTIPMPGAFCTSTSSTDLSSTCTVWVRASATDPVTGKLLRRLYRVNIRR